MYANRLEVPINEEGRSRIKGHLAVTQSGCSARLMSYEKLKDVVVPRAEKVLSAYGIPSGQIPEGVTFNWYEVYPKAVGRYATTVVDLLFTDGQWHLLSCARRKRKGHRQDYVGQLHVPKSERANALLNKARALGFRKEVVNRLAGTLALIDLEEE